MSNRRNPVGSGALDLNLPDRSAVDIPIAGRVSVNRVIDNGVFAGATRGRYHYYDDVAISPSANR